MAESTAERAGRALLASLNLVLAIVIGLVAAVLYWQWLAGESPLGIGSLPQNAVDRVQNEAYLFRVMWAIIVAAGAGGLVWIILESLRPTKR
jgi:uncharacterized membrane protein YebE (DUF533 family)